MLKQGGRLGDKEPQIRGERKALVPSFSKRPLFSRTGRKKIVFGKKKKMPGELKGPRNTMRGSFRAKEIS